MMARKFEKFYGPEHFVHISKKKGRDRLLYKLFYKVLLGYGKRLARKSGYSLEEIEQHFMRQVLSEYAKHHVVYDKLSEKELFEELRDYTLKEYYGDYPGGSL